MDKNGALFISIVDREQMIRSVWDPYSYRGNRAGKCLGDYVEAAKLGRDKSAACRSPFRPVEYADISRGKSLAFALETRGPVSSFKTASAGEGELLMGTMRAYLGNVLVTPRAEWLGLEGPLCFPVKSEFVRIAARDRCSYFWWAFLQSPLFLTSLPAGSGGTRPRLQVDSLLLTPVRVPGASTRRMVHERLSDCAEQEWRQAAHRAAILNTLKL
jgi:hypothetical protein